LAFAGSAGPWVVLATIVRLVWIGVVPTIPVGDFAMYRESANYLVERGHLDPGFIYMPGFVAALALLRVAGGELIAAKVFGALCGGLAAWPLHALTARLFDRPEGRAKPIAATAGLLYALWPGGISFASIIATDIPAAGLTLAALAALAWAASREGQWSWTFLGAHIAAGALFALASYVRAVALPLLAVSAIYLFACGFRRAELARRLGVMALTTMLLLLPWGLRNARHEGGFTLADSHGGITALMGDNPNADGTYARSLHEMWKRVTGRTFLSQPHQETDHLAWQVTKHWWRASPLWTAGMVPLRAERLFAWEHGLLYWSLYRPGVLPERYVLAAERWRRPLTHLTDGFWLLLVVAFTMSLRPWPRNTREARAGRLLLLAAAASAAVAYLLLVAEPRYRLGIEALMIPLAAVEIVSLVRLARASARCRPWLAELGPRAVSLLALGLVVWGVPRAGDAWRARGRWAVATADVDEQACFLYVTPTAPLPGARSAVRGRADQIELAPFVAEGPARTRWQLDCPRGEPLAERGVEPTTLSFRVARSSRDEMVEKRPGRASLAREIAGGLRVEGTPPVVAQATAPSGAEAVEVSFSLTSDAVVRGWDVVMTVDPPPVDRSVDHSPPRPAGDPIALIIDAVRLSSTHAPRAASSDGTR
jgi:4-amino-4-deoxy-L-arabinose transferase-like glycosyltransferase